ncbi:hypothetical protein PV433_25905 [Paenibacillus sp. GYB004]|uniref:phage adaptor protein n=1 Tax=Paenibacillus sp. GYB004 TaxID=2994393 RepID=UPI002F9698FF
MLTIQQIMDEADILVPNKVPTVDKVLQITEINRDFFETVKIPKLARFTSSTFSDYILVSDVREKNIDLVSVGMLKYRSLDGDAVNPLQPVYAFDDTTRTLTLSPAPYQSGLQGIVRYRRIGTVTYTTGNLSATPEAPEEYHGSYIVALASWLANTQDDSAKAANYEAQYRAVWNVAAQNYAGGRTS